MESILAGLRDLFYTIRLNSDRILYTCTVIFALCVGAFLGTLFQSFHTLP
jgi:hypothetical protein